MRLSLKVGVSCCMFLVGIAIVAALHHLIWLPTPLRVALVLLFLALGPGHGWIWSLRLENLVVEVGLTAGLGLSIALMVSLAMAVLDAWSPVTGMYWLLGIGLAGSLVWLANFRRRALIRAP